MDEGCRIKRLTICKYVYWDGQSSGTLTHPRMAVDSFAKSKCDRIATYLQNVTVNRYIIVENRRRNTFH